MTGMPESGSWLTVTFTVPDDPAYDEVFVLLEDISTAGSVSAVSGNGERWEAWVCGDPDRIKAELAERMLIPYHLTEEN